MSREEFKNIVTEVLQSDEFCMQLRSCMNSISGNTSQSNNTPNNVPVRSSLTPADELRRMFPSIRTPNNVTPNTPRTNLLNSGFVGNRRTLDRTNRKRTNHQAFADFKRDVLLVRKPNICKTLTGREKSSAYTNGYAVSMATFIKSWSEKEIIDYIRNLFENKLNEAEFEILIPISGNLVKPNLPQGTTIDGFTLCRLSHQKSIYIRPLRSINENNTPNIVVTDVDDPEVLEDLGEANHDQHVFENSAYGDHDAGHTILDPLMHEAEVAKEINIDNELFEAETLIATRNSTEEKKSLVEVLTQLHNDINNEEISKFNIYRQDIFNCCIRGLRRKSFSPINKISVVFTDIDDVSEGAVDMGGPTREMFRLVLKYLQSSVLFSGPEQSKNITLCHESLESKHYYEAGRIIALSLIHGGPSPNFLSETLFNYLVEGIDAVEPNLNEIMDLEIKKEIEDVRDAQGLPELQTAVWNSSFMAIAGFINVSAFEKKDKIVTSAVKYYLIHRVMPALEQFKEGLNTLKLLDKLTPFKSEFKELMCFSASKLTADSLSSLFKVKMSEIGSNKRNIEARILSFWKEYLLDCEEGESEVQLKNILCFATATEQIPPLGFQNNPELQFLHDEEFFWPKANTCVLILYLPVSYKDNEYDKFKCNMDYAILNGMAFGFA